MNGPPRPAAYFAALAAIIAGGWFAWQGWERWNAYVPLGARILSAQVDTLSIAGIEKYDVDIRYAFVYDGFELTANTLTKESQELSAKEAERLVRRYPPGTETAVYLNSQNADDVVLLRDNEFRLPLLIAGVGLVALLFLAWEDRGAWLPGVKNAVGMGPRTAYIDPRGRPPEMELTPPKGMEGAIWDPTPGKDGLPKGWVRPEDQ